MCGIEFAFSGLVPLFHADLAGVLICVSVLNGYNSVTLCYLFLSMVYGFPSHGWKWYW